MTTLKQKLDLIKIEAEEKRYKAEAMKYEYYSNMKTLIVTLTAFCFILIGLTLITLNLALK